MLEHLEVILLVAMVVGMVLLPNFHNLEHGFGQMESAAADMMVVQSEA